MPRDIRPTIGMHEALPLTCMPVPSTRRPPPSFVFPFSIVSLYRQCFSLVERGGHAKVDQEAIAGRKKSRGERGKTSSSDPQIENENLRRLGCREIKLFREI